jgi:hypothetical protein
MKEKMPYQHHSLSQHHLPVYVERRGQHQNIRQQPTDHLTAKRVSRIMANRLSAAKSRVKKLQHTADLEGRVRELQVGSHCRPEPQPVRIERVGGFPAGSGIETSVGRQGIVF